MGTLGGNLCLNTRCTYFGQSEEWRCSIDYCMKEKGTVCWVAPSSDRCWAISASDTAPVLAALGARVRLVSRAGERAIPVADLYRDDGIEWLTKRPDEILAEVLAPGRERARAAAAAPIASCAAAARSTSPRSPSPPRCGPMATAWSSARRSTSARSRRARCAPPTPRRSWSAVASTPDAIAEAARACRAAATPLDNADFTAQWRSRMVEVWAADALRACA